MATNFDKDKPAGSTKIRLSDEEIRANWAALEDALDRDHNFPGSEGVDAGEHDQVTFYAPLGADPAPGANKGAVYLKDDGGKVALFFQNEDDAVFQFTKGDDGQLMAPSGTKMYFYQNVAPDGWTIDGACADSLLAVKGGANAYNVDGGNQAGTWTQPNHTHAGGDLVATVSVFGDSKIYIKQVATVWTATYQGVITVPQASSAGLNLGADVIGDTDDGATANTYRPLAQVGIIATKD